jgi:hypothetical protein
MKKDNKDDIEKALSKSDALNQILAEITDDSIDLNKIGEGLQQTPNPVLFIDHEKLLDECRKEAKNSIDSMAKFYLSDNALKSRYVKEVIENDTLTLTSFIFQIKTTINNIKKLSEQIDMGNWTSKNFDALSNLNRTQTETTSKFFQVKVILEKKYQDLSDNYNKQVKALPEASFTSIGRGHKAMLQTLNESERETEE